MALDPPRARIPAGVLQGVRRGNVDAFLGIPYAAAPIGAQRWCPPQPAPPWSGVRLATAFGASPWQSLTPAGFGPWTAEFVVSGPVSEDCLFLNIWTPAERTNAPLPVLVWIHGGAFVQGSGSVPIYDGGALAARGVVVVTINYRLGLLGFFAHPQLARTFDPMEGCGNFGLLDQLAALRWIQAHIAAFGGNPAAVTVAGQSAGAMSVHMLVAAQQAQGLFHRAIAMSGPPTLVPVPSRAQAESIGQALAAEMHQPDLDSLRALSLDDLGLAASGRHRFGPMVDGQLIASWPPNPDPASPARRVPMLIGQTADENSALDNDYRSNDEARLSQLLARMLGQEASACLGHYMAEAKGDVAKAYRSVSCDLWLAAVWQWARRRGTSEDAPIYAYLFDHVMPGPDAHRYGAFHTSDVPYAMGTLDALSKRPFTSRDRDLSTLVSAYWLDFVRTGNPNGTGRPIWPRFATEAPSMLRMGMNTESVPMLPADTLMAVQRNGDRLGSASLLD